MKARVAGEVAGGAVARRDAVRWRHTRRTARAAGLGRRVRDALISTAVASGAAREVALTGDARGDLIRTGRHARLAALTTAARGVVADAALSTRVRPHSALTGMGAALAGGSGGAVLAAVAPRLALQVGGIAPERRGASRHGARSGERLAVALPAHLARATRATTATAVVHADRRVGARARATQQAPRAALSDSRIGLARAATVGRHTGVGRSRIRQSCIRSTTATSASASTGRSTAAATTSTARHRASAAARRGPQRARAQDADLCRAARAAQFTAATARRRLIPRDAALRGTAPGRTRACVTRHDLRHSAARQPQREHRHPEDSPHGADTLRRESECNDPSHPAHATGAPQRRIVSRVFARTKYSTHTAQLRRRRQRRASTNRISDSRCVSSSGSFTGRKRDVPPSRGTSTNVLGRKAVSSPTRRSNCTAV